MSDRDVVVSPEFLFQRLNNSESVVVDASWHLPPEKRDPRTEFLAEHIPSAVFFDLDKHSDQTSALPHMMPSAEQFGEEMGSLGISNENTIIVYDTVGLFSAARVWWMFKQFGVRNVFILNGGLPAWKAAGYPLETGVTFRPVATFEASFDPSVVINLEEMLSLVGAPDAPLILDARGPGRFFGREPEPRPGMRSGHMPGAKNLHYRTLQNDNGELLGTDALSAVLEEAGYQPGEPVVTTCGSGVTAAIITLAMHRLGYDNTRLYDGSWSEWGSMPNTPIEAE